MGKLQILALLLVVAVAGAEPKTNADTQLAAEHAEMVVEMKPGALIFHVRGESMPGYFGDSSIVVVEPVPFESVRPGMLVVYRSADGLYVAHKVIRRNEGSLTAAGTANPKVDPFPVVPEQLVGVVFCVIHASRPDLGLPYRTAYCRSF